MKLILCVLGALVCAVSAFPHRPEPQRDIPQCADPTFACQDLASARLCGTVKVCIHDIWSTMSVPDDNDEVCDICKEMVKEARDQLLSNMTQEEIKEVFEGSCKLLPIKLVADACIKVVDEIIPELVEMLASRMDPTMVCTVSGMCFATHTSNENRLMKIIQIILAKDKTTQCDQCTSLVTDAQAFMKGSSEAQVKQYIENVCDKEMSKMLCDMVLNHFFDEIYTYLLQTPPKDICSTAGVCPKTCSVGEVKVNDELTCEFCEHVLQHVKDLITANTTMEEFRTALLNFCKHVGSFSDKCTALVNDYYDMLFSYIKNLDTKGMCTLMGLCDNQLCAKVTPLVKLIPANEPRPKFPLIKLQPAIRVPENIVPLVKLIPANILSKKEMKETNDIFQPLIPLEKFVHPLSILEQDTECALCKAFSFYLEKDLAGDKSKTGVRAAIDGICGKWMVEYPDRCNRIVGKYSLKMQYAIAEGVSFENLCSNVKACPLEEQKHELLKVKLIRKSGPLCDLCKDAMNEVQKELSDPAIKEKLKNLADQGCNILPQSLRNDCVSFINQNIDAVIDILQQELKPDNICPALGLCAGAPRIVAPPRIKDLECDICKEVVTSFRQKLQDPASKTIVLTFLEEGCARLPTSVAAECKKFVDEEIDTVMSIIIQEMDPDSVCSILSICPASLMKEIQGPINDIECELCKELVTKVEDLVKDQKTEDEIKQALDKVCSYLPSSMSKECQNFVDQYINMLIDLIIQEGDPNTVCQLLNVCPATLMKKIVEPKNTVQCELCKEVVSKVESSLKDQKTQTEIVQALDKMCSYLPSSMSAKCQQFVNKYAPLVITLVVLEGDPSTVCQYLKACPASLVKAIPAPKNDIECELCKEVVSKVEDLIKDKKTEDEIKEALDKVCSYLPSSISAQCQQFVDTYTDLLVTLLIQEVDPDTICQLLKACPATPKQKKIKDIECDLCKQVVTQVENLVKDKKTEDEIRAALDKVCSYLPSSLATKCENFVNQYTELLITLLTEELDPEMICAALNVCPAQDLECEGCQEALHFLQNQLMDATTQGELKNLLKRVCNILPESFSQNCEAFIDEYGSSFLTLIAQEIDPSKMCYQLQMCTNQTKKYQKEDNGLDRFHLDECSVCTTVVDYLDKLLEEDDVDKEITQVVEKVCTVLPSSFKDKCTTMLETYGPYLLQMIGQLADSKQVCQDIDMCARSPHSVHLIGGSKCTFGPTYWCRSTAHASACKAEMYCKTNVWKN